MAFTKLQFYVGMILIVSLCSFGLVIFGGAMLNDTSITMNNESTTYINQFSSYVDSDNGGISGMNATNVAELQESQFLDDEEAGSYDVTDILAQLNYFKNRASKISGYIKFAYNIPTFMLLGLGLPISAFTTYLNIFGVILFISLIVVFIKLLQGRD
jgi:NhaP-type Na+/H+ or K+/H+ antiporter